ncbi:hypothetical protein QYM36_008062 [Artemia franciscana]|uniref:Uncharacterized protein n=1 Tax=Artemia franciscana TaxID=6661 RepID=A0AA88IEY5_ARTSF|nr:hypothetical protein QYM36_008062 [Artemia franciscana]
MAPTPTTDKPLNRVFISGLVPGKTKSCSNHKEFIEEFINPEHVQKIQQTKSGLVVHIKTGSAPQSLSESTLVNSLPDKGEKVRESVKRITELIGKKNGTVDSTVGSLLEKLTIGPRTTLEEEVQSVEWKGRNISQTMLDSDDDSDTDEKNAIGILASTAIPQKIIKQKREEKPLISKEEVARLENMSLKTYEAKIIELKKRADALEKQKLRKKFHPHRNLKSAYVPQNESDTEKSKPSWREDESAISPPTFSKYSSGGVALSLEEALILEKSQQQKYKELMMQQAMARISFGPGVPVVEKETESWSDEYDEVYDDEDDDKAGTVTFSFKE